MIVYVNGTSREVDAETQLLEVLDPSVKEEDGSTARHGVAVAVDGVVIPRTQLPGQPLTQGCRVEIVTAVQGG